MKNSGTSVTFQGTASGFGFISRKVNKYLGNTHRHWYTHTNTQTRINWIWRIILINQTNQTVQKQLHLSFTSLQRLSLSSVCLCRISLWDLFHLDAVWHSSSIPALARVSSLDTVDTFQTITRSCVPDTPLKWKTQCVWSTCHQEFICQELYRPVTQPSEFLNASATEEKLLSLTEAPAVSSESHYVPNITLTP